MMVGRAHRGAVPEDRGADRRRRAGGARPRRQPMTRGVSLTRARRRDRRPRRPRRLRPQRAGADDVRRHAGRRRRDPLDGKPVVDPLAGRGARARHRLCAGGSRHAGPGAADERAAEFLARRAAAPDPVRLHRPRRRAAARRATRSSSSASGPVRSKQVGGPALRRQPAEDRARQVARQPAAAADPRRADARHRRRRQGGDPSADGRARRAGRRHPDDLQRAAGGARHERPRAGDARGPHRRRVRARRGERRTRWARR